MEFADAAIKLYIFNSNSLSSWTFLLPCLHVPTTTMVPVMWWAHSHFVCSLGKNEFTEITIAGASLSANKITDVGAKAIALALKENKTLTSLQ